MLAGKEAAQKLLLVLLAISAVAANRLRGGAAPDPRAPTRTQLLAAYDAYKANDNGTLPTYIPELANVNGSLFAIAMADVSGNEICVGDCKAAFSIQSVSKVFSLAMALEQHGADDVRKKIGADATAAAFNAGFPIGEIDRLTDASVKRWAID